MYKTSSAEPLKLFRYSDITTSIDHDLLSESWRLAGVLQRFEATCTEYRVPVAALADQLRNHVSGAEDTDVWVRQVGMAFKLADEQALVYSGSGGGASWGITGQLASSKGLIGIGEGAWGWYKLITKVAGVLVVTAAMRVGPDGMVSIKVADLLKKFPDLLDWLQAIHVTPGTFRRWAHVGERLPKIRLEALPSHVVKQWLLKGALIDIGVHGLINLARYGWTSKFASATVVDAIIIAAATAAGALLASAVLPGGLVLIGSFVAAEVIRCIANWLVRDRAIDIVDQKLTQPAWRFVDSFTQQVSNLTTSTVTSIVQRVPEAIQAVKKITQSTVHAISGGVSAGAQAVRNITQSTVQSVATGVLQTAQDATRTTQATAQAVSRGMLQSTLMLRNATQAAGQAVFSPFVLGPALQPL